MVIKLIAYALVIIAVILNFVIPAVMKKRSGEVSTKAMVRVKIAALAVAAAALIMVLFFVR